LRRRRFLLSAAAALAPACGLAKHADEQDHVRIGLTPVFLDDQVAFLNRWREYLQARLQRPADFVQRVGYREVVDLLREDKLDFAWMCGYPFVRNRKQLRLLAVPLYNGKPLYQSYLIVPSSDRGTRSILDLIQAGKSCSTALHGSIEDEQFFDRKKKRPTRAAA